MRTIDRDQLIAELRALRPEFERGGVTRMSLFRSRARGDNRDDSDVDLIVDVDPARKFSMLDLISVGHIIEDQLGLKSSLVVMDRFTDAGFKRRIDPDCVPRF